MGYLGYIYNTSPLNNTSKVGVIKNNMNYKQFSCILGLTITSIAITTLKANALDFSFSFSNNDGTTDGSVTGIIKGLKEGFGNQRPESISLTSYPDDLGVNSNGDLVYRPLPWYEPDRSFFEVENGQIVDASFRTLGPSSEFSINYNSYGSLSSILNLGNGDVIENNAGFAGVTFTPVSATVPPDPATVPFDFSPSQGIALGLPLFIGLRMLKKRRALKNSTRKVHDLTSVR